MAVSCAVTSMPFSLSSCSCPHGYSGARCEVNVDDCQGNSCMNNATCVDRVGDYECLCRKGFEGRYCEKKIAFCDADGDNGDKCQNGGKCVDHFTHYTCECAEGFSGKDCSVNVDDCKDHMCQVQRHVLIVVI